MAMDGELSKVFKMVNLNGDKTITFTEFVMAASNKQVLLSEANILSAFEFIDYDKDEFISREDFTMFLNIKDEYFIGGLIEEADDDCDGGLNF